jgi:hypothetical protein
VGNNARFINNSAESTGSEEYIRGVIFHASYPSITVGDGAVFGGNWIRGYYAEGGLLYSVDSSASFILNGSATFRNNRGENVSRSYDFRAYLIFITNGSLKMNLSVAGQRILFEDNHFVQLASLGDKNGTHSLGSIYFYGSTATLTLNLVRGTTVELRDPVASSTGGAFGSITKGRDPEPNLEKPEPDGLGRFILWGDNSRFTGTVTIEEGPFYFLFDRDSQSKKDSLCKPADPAGQLI